ncbi:MAG: hypothetical protein HGB08_02100 [Candidatus Moranbacteria bacterium]|nr:hypothetical protein [Candidatus Moranbacteria bacterium]
MEKGEFVLLGELDLGVKLISKDQVVIFCSSTFIYNGFRCDNAPIVTMVVDFGGKNLVNENPYALEVYDLLVRSELSCRIVIAALRLFLKEGTLRPKEAMAVIKCIASICRHVECQFGVLLSDDHSCHVELRA